ncbi:MAG: DUF4115 domain-containing protein [Gaiellales bacterium]
MFDIGSSLREARTRQGLAFDEMELRTKVRAKYLRFLEEERFDQLPGHTYTKGFLRAYADALGLDGDLYVDEYNSRYVGFDDEAHPRLPTRPPRGRDRRRQRSRESRIVFVALTAILVVTALVIAAWRFGGEDTPRVQGINETTTVNASGATIVVRSIKGPTYLEVRVARKTRRDSGNLVVSDGKLLFSGTLERGSSQRFLARDPLFVSVTKPRNVVVTSDGRRVPLRGGGVIVGGRTAVGG